MGFFKGLVDDAQKDINPAIVVALALTAAVIIWGFMEVFKTGRMPSSDSLIGAAYLLGGSGAMNVCHKAEDIIARFKKSPDSPAPDPAPDLKLVS